MSPPEPELESPRPDDRYRAIVDAQADLISLARFDGTLVYVNAAYARNFGASPRQMIGRSLFDHVLADDQPAVRRLFAGVLATGRSTSSENRMLGASGLQRWVEWTNSVQQDGDDVLLLSVGRDITERKALEQEVRDNESFVRKITDSLPVRIAYLDRELRFRFANAAHCRRFGRERAEILGRTRDELLGRPASEAVNTSVAAVLAGVAQRFEYEEATADALHSFDIQLTPDVGPDGQVRGFFYSGLDVSERKRAERSLHELTREAQRQSDVLHLVTDAIPATVVVVGADTRYRFANGAFEALCGRPREQIVGRTVVEILGADEVARRRPYVLRALAGESVTFTLDYPGAEGTRWLELAFIPLRLGGGAVDGFVGISQDVTQQRLEQYRLTELSQRDALTLLLNRAGFESRLERLTLAGGGAAVALLYVDLDRFKPVNDNFGHPVGDRLLQIVAQRLAGLVRPTDAVARLGGDEFAIVLADVATLADAEAVASKVVAAMAMPFDIDARVLEIGASVGVAYGVRPPGDWRELVQRADAMLYRAKNAGRGRYASS
ncbi:MAG: PAS domain-containing protein [Betaproteobacteria bacterium]